MTKDKKEQLKEKYADYMKDKKTIFTFFALFLAFLITILLSFGFEFFFSDLSDGDFWGDLAIKFALCVYCLYFGIPEAKNYYMKKKDGRYQVARGKFIAIREKVNLKDDQFNQWLENYYVQNKLDYYKSILSLHGNINPYVLDLDYTELNELSHPYKKDWTDTEFNGRPITYFRTLNQEQIEIIKDIFNGKIVVEQIPNDFFKSFNGNIVTSEYVEQGRESRKKTRKYIGLIFSRIVLLFAIAFVFSFFGIRKTSGDPLTETIKLFIRLWTMLSSFIYGFVVGKIMVQDQSTRLEYKTRINELFFNDKNFKALDSDELAKKEYEKYEKNIVKPEIIDMINENTYNNSGLLENNGDKLTYEQQQQQ